MNLSEYRNKYNALAGMSDERAVKAIQRVEFPEKSVAEVAKTLGVKMPEEPKPERTWGEAFKPYPGTEVWGLFENDYYAGKPAVIHRKLGKGTVTYIGVDSRKGDLEKAVLQKVYQVAGVPVLDLPQGLLIEYRDGLGIAVNYSDQTLDLPLAKGAKHLIGQLPLPTTGVLVWKVNE